MDFTKTQFQIDALHNTVMFGWIGEGPLPQAQITVFGVHFDAGPNPTKDQMEHAAQAAVRHMLEQLIATLPAA